MAIVFNLPMQILLSLYCWRVGIKVLKPRIFIWLSAYGGCFKMILKDFNETFDHELRNSEFAALYLKTALQENGIDGFLLALRNVSHAKGNNAIAEVNDLSSVSNLLFSLGLQLSVEPAQQNAHTSQATPST
jgi:hypothetical protein